MPSPTVSLLQHPFESHSKVLQSLITIFCFFFVLFFFIIPDFDDKKLAKPLSPKKAYSEKKDTVKRLVDAGKEGDVKYSDQDVATPNVANTNEAGTNGNITFDADPLLKDHKYFVSKFVTDPEEAKRLWVDMSQLPKLQSYQHEILSNSHRRAASIPLPFKFPFYGYNCTRTTVATGGFLYMVRLVQIIVRTQV